MFNLTFLSVPIIAALATFVFAVATDYQTVFIDRINVPSSVSGSTGFTPDVVIARLADEMRQIEDEASSKAEARALRLQGDRTIVSVLGEFLKVTPLIRVAQDTAGLIPFSFSGEVVAIGKNKDLEMTLRGTDAEHKFIFLVQKAPPEELTVLIRRMAFEVMREIDPYILAAYQFKRDYQSRDFTDTVEIIRRELDKPVNRNHRWLQNLWGIVLYQQGDRPGAIAKFTDAIKIDPKFLSPHLNWGVVQARQGEFQNAIEHFQEVVKLGAGDVSNATVVAAAYTEWGFSLALLGKQEQAFEKFAQASAISPSFAEVYASWAEVLSVAGRKEEAAKMTARAVELAPTEAIYTENLIGPVQNLPAAAMVR